MAHGTFNPNKEFYSLVLTRCDQALINSVLGPEYKCRNDTEFEDILKHGGTIHFNFIDQYFDILEYENPIKKYFYRIENTLDKDNYSINYLNFNPLTIITHNGYLFDNTQKEFTYT